jgi:dolichol-phosphate mannosyltransferase
MAEPARVLSVVVPAYNEEAVIAVTLRALIAHLDQQQVEYEIIVVNDASRDGTEAVLCGLEASAPRLRHVTNPGPHGYGCAVRFGLRHFTGDAVVVVMADGSDSPEDVVAYFRKIQEGYDCAFGMRFGPGSRVTGYPRFKRVLNRAGNRLIAWLVGSGYTDFTNGFKCFHRDVIARIQPLVGAQFNLTIEMSIKAVLSGARVAVVPNSWIERAEGVSKFNVLRVSWMYLLTIMYCLMQDRLARGGIVR